MQRSEHAELLLRKAAQDELVVSFLVPNAEAPDEAIGFHAQQAVEKLLKAVLAFNGIRYRWRHDLVELIDLLRESGIACPDDLDDVRRLNPFATEFRYDELPEEAQERLDRSWAVGCVVRTRQWAESVIYKHRGE